MILLAFLLHTTLELIDTSFRTVRNSLPSRRTFFEHLRTLIHYLPFDDGDHLMRFMLRRLDHAPLQQAEPSFSINPLTSLPPPTKT